MSPVGTLLREDSRGSRPGRYAPASVSLLVHTRLIHGGVRLGAQACTWFHGSNINNVLLNGIIDFDLLIIRLSRNSTWSEDHLIYYKK